MAPDSITHEALAAEFQREGFVVLRQLFDTGKLREWSARFAPLLAQHIERERDHPNRGNNRYYVTLPFSGCFADPEIFENDTVLAVVERIVGRSMVMCQLATDTPLQGSDYQALHRDTPPLFPEEGIETPSFQLAVNFPLCDVTLDNGPLELVRGTHRRSREESLGLLASGERTLEPLTMQLGDVVIRDVRQLHRGTPNRTDAPRPMVVIGYSRGWLFRPEVSIRVPRSVHAGLSARARSLLRFNTVVDDDQASLPGEAYREFSY
jgi:ectoine hydroxylase-related dioxygenase (phytanoyl-CoA dioxygenase family)